MRVQDVARVELGGAGLRHQLLSQRQAGGRRSPSSSGPAPMRSVGGRAVKRKMEELKQSFPPGLDYSIVYNPTEFIADFDQRGLPDAARGDHARRPRHHRLPAVLAHGDHPDHRHPGLADRHLRGDGGLRLLAQHADAVRPGAGHRHRRRRRHRRGRERRAQHRATGCRRARRRTRRWTRSARRSSPSRWCSRAVFIPTAFIPGISGPVLPAVRADHRGLDRHLGLQLADPVAGARARCCSSRTTTSRRALDRAAQRSPTASTAASTALSRRLCARRRRLRRAATASSVLLDLCAA